MMEKSHFNVTFVTKAALKKGKWIYVLVASVHEGKKPSILHTILFITPGTFCMHFLKDDYFWWYIYMNIKKTSLALIKMLDHVFGCVSCDIFFPYKSYET